MIDPVARRDFLRLAASAGAVWAVAEFAPVEDALLWAREQAAAPAGTFTVLTPAQARTAAAAAARIIPSVDGRPGAREAGAVYFVDKALATFNGGQKTAYAKGLADLDARAARRPARSRSFADLPSADQDAVLRDIEKTPFFAMLRADVIVGCFALPSWGGNTDHMGWHLLGLDHQPAYQPPFGAYDAAARRS